MIMHSTPTNEIIKIIDNPKDKYKGMVEVEYLINLIGTTGSMISTITKKINAKRSKT